MASPISCLSILIIPLLVTSLFYDVSNADRSLVEKICRASMDHDYCLSVLLSDPEGLTNVLYRLGLVATSVSLKIIPGVKGEIGNVLIGVKDKGTRDRITGCQADIDIIYDDMEQARTAAGTQSYKEEAKSLASAQDKIAFCNQRFVTMQSPIKSSTSKIEKLINICAVILQMI
nr:hypothetical protein CFP56_61383 [Quercus suber]